MISLDAFESCSDNHIWSRWNNDHWTDRSRLLDNNHLQWSSRILSRPNNNEEIKEIVTNEIYHRILRLLIGHDEISRDLQAMECIEYFLDMYEFDRNSPFLHSPNPRKRLDIDRLNEKNFFRSKTRCKTFLLSIDLIQALLYFPSYLTQTIINGRRRAGAWKSSVIRCKTFSMNSL